MRVLSLLVVMTSMLYLPAAEVHAAAKKKKETAEAQPQKEAGSPELNACGCYQLGDGSCKCVKKSKCGCAGECEPAGCEEKRRKEQEREAQEEVKRQQDTEKKRNAEMAKKRDEQERNEDGQGKHLRGGKPEGKPEPKPAE
jgi:hypothetical protein